MSSDFPENPSVDFLGLIWLYVLGMTYRAFIVTHAVPLVGPLGTAVNVVVQVNHFGLSVFLGFKNVACYGHDYAETHIVRAWPFSERENEKALHEPTD
jgi:hypothetical protein